jgi:hypothetical protein
MPAYAFEIRWNKREKISWTYLATDGRARNFARILMQSLKSSGQYSGVTQMVVKNDEEVAIASFQF